MALPGNPRGARSAVISTNEGGRRSREQRRRCRSDCVPRDGAARASLGCAGGQPGITEGRCWGEPPLGQASRRGRVRGRNRARGRDP